MVTIYNISCKGGLGKTSISIAQAWYYINQGHSVRIIDSNSMNPDISEHVFRYFITKSTSGTSKMITENNIVHEITRTDYAIDAKNPIRTFSVLNATHIRNYDIFNLRDIPGMVTIVDTNCSMANIPEDMHFTQGSEQKYFWFLWCWALPGIKSSLQNILKSINKIEERFPARQVVHVLNMYDLFQVGHSLFRKKSRTIKPLFKILKEIDIRMNNDAYEKTYFNADIMREMTYKIGRNLTKEMSPKEIDIERIPVIWASELWKTITSEDWMPYNILLIPTFFEELVMSMDRMMMAEVRSWDDIHSLISPIMNYVSTFIGNLPK